MINYTERINLMTPWLENFQDIATHTIPHFVHERLYDILKEKYCHNFLHRIHGNLVKSNINKYL